MSEEATLQGIHAAQGVHTARAAAAAFGLVTPHAAHVHQKCSNVPSFAEFVVCLCTVCPLESRTSNFGFATIQRTFLASVCLSAALGIQAPRHPACLRHM
eukprot:365260-Chlamydomonas_euryale.AAC.3